MGQKCQYLAKKRQFGAKFGHFGPKIIIFMGVSKSCCTNIMEKPPRQLVCIVFGRLGIKWAKKADIRPKMPVFGQVWPFLGQKDNFLGGLSKTYGTLTSRNQRGTFFVLNTLTGEAPIGSWKQKCAFLTQKF